MAKAQAETAELEPQGILDSEGEGFTFDMESQSTDDGFPTVDKGVYDLSLDALEYKISASSGNPMWAMRWLVTGPGEDVAAKKVTVRYYQSFKPDQMGRAKAFLEKIGRADLCTKDFNPKTIADDAVLIGTTARARLDVRNDATYGTSNEIKGFLSKDAAAGASGAGGFQM